MTTVDRSRLPTRVEDWVQRVVQRMNFHEWCRVAWWTAALSGGVMLPIALGYVLFGQRVPWPWYPGLFGAAAMIGAAVWWVRRATPDVAAQRVDRQFGLKDAVRSCRNFTREGRRDGFYRLQAMQTDQQVARCDLQQIRFQVCWPLVACAAILVPAAVALGFLGPSASVLEREARAEQTLASTADINEELSRLVDELDAAIEDEEERQLINPDQLREWVDELTSTADPKVALRQYAKIERMIQQAAEAMQNRREEQLLDRVAAALKNEESHRPLADLLKQKKYDRAADELEKMRPAHDPQQPRTLTDRQKELAKLRATAQRMAAAARTSPKSGSSKSPTANTGQSARATASSANTADPSQEGAGSTPEEVGADAEAADAELEALLQELDEAMEALDRAIERAAQCDNEQDREFCEGECSACEAAARQALSRVQDRLRRLARSRSAQARLQRLAQECANCQSSMMARIQSPDPGGRKAGEGTSDRQREESEEPPSDGPVMGLRGIRGDGPALSRIQSADSGEGVSQRRGQAIQREFQRQLESFVEREDISEELKNGVREYFLRIHQQEEEATGAVDGESTDRGGNE